MNVKPMERSLLLKKVNDRDFDAVTLAWVSSPRCRLQSDLVQLPG